MDQYNNFYQMTSQENLSQDFNYFIYSTAGGKQLKDVLNINRDLLWKQFNNVQGMIQQKQNLNLEIRQQMKINAQRYANSYKIFKKTKDFQVLYKNIDFSAEVVAFSLNTQAFLITIELIGNKEQVAYWQQQVYAGKVIGAYGQTQLGHGSNVQALQTQAHYDENDGTFKINSPTIISSKFWPGLLGTFATHCVLQAKTFVKGKSIGVQTFVFEMRDQKLNNLPGVEAGQIGAKLGFSRVDNGYLKISNVKIGRECMLAKYVKVERDGKVIGLQNKQAIKYAYGSMLNLRVRLTNGFSIGFMSRVSSHLYSLFTSAKIEKIDDNKKQVVDGMCTGYGFILANAYTKTLFNNFINQLRKQDFNAADNWLILCHIVSSTFKALSSWACIRILSLSLTSMKTTTFNVSSFPFLFVEAIPSATYEGDNTVLLQQTAKYMLMKEEYEKQLIKPSLQINPSDIEGSYRVLEYVTALEVKRLKRLFEKETDNGVGFNTFWNQKYQRQIVEAAKLWGYKACLNGLLITLKGIQKHKEFYVKISKVFCSVILNCSPHLPLYGFNVQQTNDWNSFTDTEFNTLMNLDFPFKRGLQFNNANRGIKLVGRSKWMEARL